MRIVDAENNRFGFSHVDVGCRIAEKWGLPDSIIDAIRHHHDDVSAILKEDSDTTALTAAVYVASHSADLFMNTAAPNAAVLVDSVCGRYFGLDTQILLDRTREQMDQIGPMFDVNTETLPAVVDVMADANRRLAEMLMSESVARTQSEQKLEETLRENNQLRDSSARDETTGALTREKFDESVVDQLTVAGGRYPTAAVLLIEPDNRDFLSSKYGDSIQEVLLRESASLVGDCVGTGDLIARFDRNQLVVLMHAENQTDIESTVERMRHLVSNTMVVHEGQTIPCSISIGGVVFTPDRESASSYEGLQQAAWFRLDQARKGGGNCVSLSVISKSTVNAD